MYILTVANKTSRKKRTPTRFPVFTDLSLLFCTFLNCTLSVLEIETWKKNVVKEISIKFFKQKF